MTTAGVMLGALIIEGLVGWPRTLHGKVRHPVVWIGALISVLEQRLNRGDDSHTQRYVNGLVTSVIVAGIVAVIAFTVAWLLPNSFAGFAVEAAIASSLLAGRSLYDHVGAVARPLAAGDLCGARRAVGHIVGRDPTGLDEAGIARASLESLAENASDGVIAPLFWGILLGLPGLAAYKAVNTLDSMIGHRNKRYHAFGGFAARLDDVANWLPARLTACLFAIASGTRFRHVIKIIIRDSSSHRSPNAGWPESAMAGALDIRLSGPRIYEDRLTNEPWLNGEAADPGTDDIVRGQSLYVRMLWIAGISLLALFAVG